MYYRFHVVEWNSGAEYYDGFVCPADTLVHNLIRTILGGNAFHRLVSVTFGKDKTVLSTDTLASLEMEEDVQYNFYVKLTILPGEPHRFGMKWKND